MAGSPVTPRLSRGGSSPVRSAKSLNESWGFLIYRMSYYVYIIYSQTHEYYYKGSTEDPVRRNRQHNEGMNASTKGKGPWQMVFVRSFGTKKEAMKEERRLKRTNTAYLQWLIEQPINEISAWREALSRLD